MTNYPISDISEAEDIETINMYHERIAQGFTKEEIIASINAKGRDNARTPMQWDDSENAGFTTGTPWLHVNPNYHEINVANALEDKNSIFYTYQKLIRLRKEHPLVVWGEYELLTTTLPDVFAYTRSYEGKTWLVVANVSQEKNVFTLPAPAKKVIIANYPCKENVKDSIVLRPYEAFVVEI